MVVRKTVKTLSVALRLLLEAVWPRGTNVVALAKTSASLLPSSPGKNTQLLEACMDRELLNTLYEQAQKAMANAYNPYSNYSVGAAMLTDTGNYYAGCNVENVSYRLTLCAEAAAIGTMASTEGKTTVKHALVMASGGTFPSPCGACRQIIAEFATPETKIHLVRPRENGEGFDVRTYAMAALLPLSFTQQILWEPQTSAGLKENPVSPGLTRGPQKEETTSALKPSKKQTKTAAI